MCDLVTQARRGTGLIGEITSSTLAQSSGITRFNQAVTQLDQATRQHATLEHAGTEFARSAGLL